MKIALSGMRLQETRVTVAADNIANVRSGAPAPKDGESYQGYEAKTVEGTSQVGGGVIPSIRNVDPSYVLAPGYEQGTTEALPNVDLANEAATLMTAEKMYEANAKVIKTQDELDKSLLDIMS